MSGTTYTINADGNFVTKMDRMADSVNKLNKKLADTADKGKKAKEGLSFDIANLDKAGSAITGIASKWAAAAASGAALIALMKQADALSKTAMEANRSEADWIGMISTQERDPVKRAAVLADYRKSAAGFKTGKEAGETFYGLGGAGMRELYPVISALRSTGAIDDPTQVGPGIKAVLANQNEGLTEAEIFATFQRAGDINSRKAVPAMLYGGKYALSGTQMPGVNVADLATAGAIISSGKTSTETGAESANALMLELAKQGAGTKKSASLMDRILAANPEKMTSEIAKAALRTMQNAESQQSFRDNVGDVRAAQKRGMDYLFEVSERPTTDPIAASESERRVRERQLEIARGGWGADEALQQAQFAKEQMSFTGSPFLSGLVGFGQGVLDYLPGTPMSGSGMGGAPGTGFIEEMKKQTMLLEKQLKKQERSPQAPKPENP